ncbi:hypothetical protein MKEN_00962900 [Mycena kentingensis (nom. inval.)]|nr:hypothetical protein MKEN_00962900 [Mycena kentingensis (nom. inval.)]
MYVPFLTRRRGGGRSGGSSSSGGKGSSSSSGKGTSSSSSSGKSSGSSSSSTGKTINSGGASRSSSTTSFGGGKVSTISSGIFSGRSIGGGNRGQVYGTRTYGSGYPGVAGRGVAGRGFPFYFWPLAFGGGLGYTSHAAYMHSDEYGRPDNSSRPGGAMSTATFQSNFSSPVTTLRLTADNDTITTLIPILAANCSARLTLASALTTAQPMNYSAVETLVQPESVVQYYRASSVALTLDGYNNSAVFADENTTAANTDTLLPGYVDAVLLGCLNTTIAQNVPLVDGALAFGAAAGGWAWLLVLATAIRLSGLF